MEFNDSKCYSMIVTLNRNKIRTNYRINEKMVENMNSCKYLGVYISSKMQCNETVDHMVSKANSTLGLLKRNFSACWSGIRKTCISHSFVLNLNTLVKFGQQVRWN